MMKAHQITPEQAQNLNGDWLWELKVDGSREFWNKDTLLSSRQINHNSRFRHIHNALQNVNAIIDGEMALDNDGGLLNSNVLELNKKENWDRAKFIVFDIVEYNDEDIRSLSLVERQDLLKDIVKIINSPHVKFIPQFDTFEDGWKFVIDNDLEGLMAKRKESTYETRALREYRSHNWLKVKNWLEGKEMIVGHNIRDTEKGSFTMANGSNINCPDMVTLREYQKAIKDKKKVFAEFYYRLKYGNSFVMPILKRLVLE